MIPTSEFEIDITYYGVRFIASGAVGIISHPEPLTFSAGFLWEKLHQEIFTFINAHFNEIAEYCKDITTCGGFFTSVVSRFIQQ